MIEWLNQLKIVEIIIGILVFGAGAIFSVVKWWRTREAARDTSIKTDVGREAEQHLTRLSNVEDEVERLDVSFARLEARMTEGFRDVDERFHSMELEMQTLARREDTEAIKLAQARMESRTETLLQNDRIMHDRMNRQGEELTSMVSAVIKKMSE